MSLSKKDTMKKHRVKDSNMGNYRVKLGQKHGQPERSKREDLVNLRLKCPNCFFEWEKNVNPIKDEIGLCPQCLL